MDNFGNGYDVSEYWQQYIGSMLDPYGFFVGDFFPLYEV